MNIACKKSGRKRKNHRHSPHVCLDIFLYCLLLGYMTTTQIKFLITLEDNAISADQSTVDETIKRLFIKIHRLYVEYTLNPFSSLNKEIISDRFDSKIKEIVTAYNRAVVSDL